MRIKSVAHARHAQTTGTYGQITPYSCGGSIAVTRPSITETRIPILAAALRRGVEDSPQRIEFGRTTRILTGVGGCRSHFARPEMADGAVAARENVVAGRIGIMRGDVIARVVARPIRIDLVPRPAARLFGLDRAIGERATNTNAMHRSRSGSLASQVPMKEVHIGQGFSRCGPNM